MTYRKGDVFQITPAHGRQGWIGALVLATEIHDWGIQGFVPHIVTHDQPIAMYIRLKWSDIEFVGHAPYGPADDEEDAP